MRKRKIEREREETTGDQQLVTGCASSNKGKREGGEAMASRRWCGGVLVGKRETWRGGFAAKKKKSSVFFFL